MKSIPKRIRVTEQAIGMLKLGDEMISQVTAVKKGEYDAAVAVEVAGKGANVEDARTVIPTVLAKTAQAVDVVARLGLSSISVWLRIRIVGNLVW